MRSKLMLLFVNMLLLSFLIPFQVLGDSKLHSDSLTKILETKTGLEKLEVYNQLIISLNNLNPAHGIDIAREAIKLADQLGSEEFKAKLLNEEAVCYRKLSIYENSLMLHFEALKIFEKLNDSMGIAFTYANIGNVYYGINEFEDALTYHYKSLAIKEELKDKSQIAYSYNAIGMSLIRMNDQKQALKYFHNAIELRKKKNETLEMANIYGNMGDAMVKLNQFDDALEYLNLAQEIYTNEKADYGLALIYNRKAEVYYLFDALDMAYDFLKKAESLALIQKNFGLLQTNYDLQSKILEKKKLYKEALHFTNKAYGIKDSLLNERKFYEMSEIRVRYETNRLDADNEILRLKVKEQDMRLKLFVFLFISACLIFIALLAFWRYLKDRKMNQNLALVNQSLEERVNERTTALSEQILAREVALNSLRQSEEKFKTISETSPSGIAVTNEKGQIVFMNDRLLEITGIVESQFLKGSWLSNIFFDDRSEAINFWNSIHQDDHQVREFSFRMIRDEVINWFYLKVAPIFNEKIFIGFVAVIDNITSQKEFEFELIRSKNKAEESDKLKSAFLANMSHEIRTPMNAILGFSDLLSSNEYDEEEKTEFINMIKSSGKLLLNLINDIIDISKIEAGELKIQATTFQVVSVLDESYNTFRQQLDQSERNGVKLIFNHRAAIENAMITTDRLRLQQIMTNLLSNAVKFTHSGEIEFGVIHIGDHYEFYVRDSGIGIPASKLDVVFERFRQADDSHTRLYGGTGLGLAITRNLTHLLGGKIWVESVEGSGTVFYFTLPADPEQYGNDTLAQIKEQNDNSYFIGKTILIVEDIETNLQLAGLMIRRLDCNVMFASNGFIALDIVSKTKVDLILMDIQMPEMDGITAMKKVKEIDNHIPIVAVTAFSILGEDQKYLDMGFDGFVSKPFNIESLIATFKNIFNFEKH
jgi:PAS domain S-box-containing protein